jgi:BirA family biotin operon repressor/biotin-[acetyl-CoA-carboxylase] ligase
VYKILANLSFSADQLHYLPSCHSTNEIAQEYLKQGAKEGTIIITDDQFAGKGQKGNEWHSEPGQNLTFSLILKPQPLAPKQQFLITVAISLAIKDALENYLPGEVIIKWPNDIYIDRKKLAGMLIENTLRGTKFESCILGIGINVNQLAFKKDLRATSMAVIGKKSYERNEVFNQLLVAIDKYYSIIKNGTGESLLPQYHAALLGYGVISKFKTSASEFDGVIEGTDDFGRLIIRDDEKLLVFQHKEVAMII